MKRFFGRVVPIIFGAVVITALGIDAADTMQGNSGTLLGQLAGSAAGTCPAGMLEVPAATTFTCVDQYEASAQEDCPAPTPMGEFDTQKNLLQSGCSAESKAGAVPWRFIDRESAQTACVRAGKRLPTNEEWQLIAAGTPDGVHECNISGSSVKPAGAQAACQSAAGVFDAVGNAWEWTHDDVFDGVYNGRPLPTEGYVAQVDRGGVASVSTSTPVTQFGSDYLWTDEVGSYAIMRGGFYGSKTDAGVYAVHAATAPTMQGTAIGFRCVQ